MGSQEKKFPNLVIFQARKLCDTGNQPCVTVTVAFIQGGIVCGVDCNRTLNLVKLKKSIGWQAPTHLLSQNRKREHNVIY